MRCVLPKPSGGSRGAIFGAPSLNSSSKSPTPWAPARLDLAAGAGRRRGHPPTFTRPGREGRRSKKGKRLATDTRLESTRHPPGGEVYHMNTPVPLAGDEEPSLMKGTIHRLPADRHCGLAAKRWVHQRGCAAAQARDEENLAV